MKKFVYLNKTERAAYFQQVGAQMNISPINVEKDFWVCWTLNELFSISELAPNLTFKGGTSLSKVWHLIQRFSEDIDLTISREFFGFGGDNSPEQAESNKKRKKLLGELKAACQQYVGNTLLPKLIIKFKENLPKDEAWTLTLDLNDVDSQTLLFQYPSSFDALQSEYIRPIVKIEFGARSDPWPCSTAIVRSFVSEIYPKAFKYIDISVQALSAERTFWEKSMLIHEETYRPIEKPRGPRMARHYYDLWCLFQKGVAQKAIADDKLFDDVISHRQVFFPQNWVDYSTMKKGTIQLVPRGNQIDGWRSDYLAMNEMFLGFSPTFDALMEVISTLERNINS